MRTIDRIINAIDDGLADAARFATEPTEHPAVTAYRDGGEIVNTVAAMMGNTW